MIAAGLCWAEMPGFDLSRIPASLALLSGASFSSETIDGEYGARTVLAESVVRPLSVRGRPVAAAAWRAARTPSGCPVLLAGWIDNSAEIARELGLARDCDPAALYGAAVEAFGRNAETRVVGDYAAITVMGPGVLRLARAPWARHTLFWAAEGSLAVASSIPRPIFATGFSKVGDPDQYAATMFRLGGMDDDRHFIKGVRFVPPGAVVTLDHGRASTEQWYDPHALPPTRLKRDEDYVRVANDLLAESVGHALKPSRRPGILLSGGLDSPLVAAEMLRQMPADQTLPSFTFEPMRGEHGAEAPGVFHSDRPAVEAFAAMHPRMRPTFADNTGTTFQQRLSDYFLAADAAYPSLALIDMEGPRQAAADAGCDWLFTADFGNQTFSSDGRWAFTEFLHRGRWLELWRMLRDHPGDERPILRRLAARSLMPALPQAVRSALRTLVHGPPARSILKADVVERLGLERQRRKLYGDREWPATRRQLIEMEWQHISRGTEMTYAVEQLTGLRMRAIPAYRPLIEFCMSIPTEQYVRNGQSRWLARRMAVGRMPEPQRLNTRYGLHNVDWLERNRTQLPDIREELERIADDPVMSQIIDVDRALERIDAWPDKPDRAALTDVFLPIAAAVIGSRFARYVDGRN